MVGAGLQYAVQAALELNVQVPYTRSQAGLHLLVDSTGIKFLGEGEWKCKKHGPELRRQ